MDGWNLARRNSLLTEPTCSIKRNETQRRAVDATAFQTTTSQVIEYLCSSQWGRYRHVLIKAELLDAESS